MIKNTILLLKILLLLRRNYPKRRANSRYWIMCHRCSCHLLFLGVLDMMMHAINQIVWLARVITIASKCLIFLQAKLGMIGYF